MRTAPWVGACVVAAALAPNSAQAQRVLTNTEHVEDLAVSDGALWVATRGGLERYDTATATRTRLYTTLDGLEANHVVSVEARGGGVTARTRGADCALAGDAFACSPADRPWQPRIAPAERWAGRRVTAHVRRGDVRYVGTAGAGVFRVPDDAPPERLTPGGQICGNHVTEVVEHGGRVFVGTFAEGLCVREGVRFRRLETPFRMINALASTPSGLYVATTHGLFRSSDGKGFARVARRVVHAGASGLDYDGTHLWVTTPGALLRLRLRRGDPPSRAWWRPGGTTAIQGVRAAPGGVAWIATEDRGLIRVQGDTVRVFDRAAGLPSSWTLAVDVDGDGGAFVGTLRHGLVHVDARGRHRPVPVPDPWLLHIRGNGDGVYVGTQAGAFLLRDGEVHPVTQVPDPRVHEVREVDGALWIGTEGGTLVTQPPAPGR
jgi:ligand-binding sensor domain-containing protein